MKRISYLALGFAFFSLIFMILLILFRSPFPAYPLISYQDTLDILTPLVLIPLYWLMFRNAGKDRSSQVEEIAFMVFASVWVIGQGMHLSANSINNLAGHLAEGGELDILGTRLYELIYLFDEHLSHLLWHLGILGLAVVLVYREWRDPAGIRTIWWATVLGGFLYGFTLFAVFIEGQSAILGFTFALLFCLSALIWGRKILIEQPILAFFFVTFLVVALFIAVWCLYWGGCPEFGEVGLL